MIDAYHHMNFHSLLELKRLCEEALTLYDYCLTEGDPEPLSHFIEEKLAEEPPPLLLLYEIADELHQRLVTLQEHLYDVQQQLVAVLQEMYQTDVARLLLPDRLGLDQLIDEEAILHVLSEQGITIVDEERPLLRQMIRRALATADRLQRDVQLTITIQDMVVDWVNALVPPAVRSRARDFDPAPRHLL